MMISPLHLLVWLPGLLWLLLAPAARRWQAIGVLYVIFLAVMLALHAKDYYLAPIYPVYIAAGAVFWTRWAADFRLRATALRALAFTLTAALFLTLPFAVPVLSPPHYVRYARALHFAPIESEQHKAALLPEFFADHLGWQSLADAVYAVYTALPADERSHTGILTANYGQASAVDVLDAGRGVPVAVSGHQNFWLWGPHGYTGEEMIIVTPEPISKLLAIYRSCELKVAQRSPYQMEWEQRGIYLCRDRRQPLTTSWPELKLYW